MKSTKLLIKKQYLNQQNITLSAAVASLFVMAAQPISAAEVNIPDSGSLLLQTRPSQQPSSSNGDTGLKAPEVVGITNETPVDIKHLTITGNTIFDNQVLHDLVKAAEGQTKTLTEIQALCKVITDYYRTNGYPLARAILPEQTIENGQVNIQVVEANLGKVKLNNESRIKDSLLNKTLASLKPGIVVKESEMNKALLLVTDIPGAMLDASYNAGEHTGESDLIVNVKPKPFLSGRVGFDDYGNQFINRIRATGNLSLNNLLGMGDVLDLNILTTGNKCRLLNITL